MHSSPSTVSSVSFPSRSFQSKNAARKSTGVQYVLQDDEESDMEVVGKKEMTEWQKNKQKESERIRKIESESMKAKESERIRQKESESMKAKESEKIKQSKRGNTQAAIKKKIAVEETEVKWALKPRENKFAKSMQTEEENRSAELAYLDLVTPGEAVYQDIATSSVQHYAYGPDPREARIMPAEPAISNAQRDEIAPGFVDAPWMSSPIDVDREIPGEIINLTNDSVRKENVQTKQMKKTIASATGKKIKISENELPFKAEAGRRIRKFSSINSETVTNNATASTSSQNVTTQSSASELFASVAYQSPFAHLDPSAVSIDAIPGTVPKVNLLNASVPVATSQAVAPLKPFSGSNNNNPSGPGFSDPVLVKPLVSKPFSNSNAALLQSSHSRPALSESFLQSQIELYLALYCLDSFKDSNGLCDTAPLEIVFDGAAKNYFSILCKHLNIPFSYSDYIGSAKKLGLVDETAKNSRIFIKLNFQNLILRISNVGKLLMQKMLFIMRSALEEEDKHFLVSRNRGERVTKPIASQLSIVNDKMEYFDPLKDFLLLQSPDRSWLDFEIFQKAFYSTPGMAMSCKSLCNSINIRDYVEMAREKKVIEVYVSKNKEVRIRLLTAAVPTHLSSKRNAPKESKNQVLLSPEEEFALFSDEIGAAVADFNF